MPDPIDLSVPWFLAMMQEYGESAGFLQLVNGTTLKVDATNGEGGINADIELIGNDDPAHFNGIQILGVNVNVDFPAIIIQARAPSSLNLLAKQLFMNSGADAPGTFNLGGSGDVFKIAASDGEIGFFGATGQTRQTVSGSVSTDLAGLQAVVVSLLAALGDTGGGYNLIHNTTT